MFNNTPSPAPQSPCPLPITHHLDTAQFPRGECRYIHSTPTPDRSSRSRCPCQAFWLEDDIPGSTCKCGHQAWAHVLDTPIASVPIEEHTAVVERVRSLEQELERERQQREEEVKKLYNAIQGVYGSLALLSNQTRTRMIFMDDRIEGVLDQTHACHGSLNGLQEKVITIDDATMDLETRVDRLESVAPPSKSPSPASEPISVPEKSPALPPHVSLHDDPSWTAKVMFMPRSSGPPFPIGSIGYRRCLSRNLLRELHFPDDSSSAFVSVVDEAFLKLLRNRSWMPLIAYRSSLRSSERAYSLQGLPADKCSPGRWDRDFLQEYCVHYEKELGAVINISLESGDSSWTEIKQLPNVHGLDQSCWEYVSELDSPRARTNCESDEFGLGVEESCDLPPYTSRAPSDAGQVPLPTPQLGLPLQQRESTTNRDFEASEDEHTLKKICLRPKSEGLSDAREAMPELQPQYISGRTKRKVAVKEKQVQSCNRRSDWRHPVQTFLHNHHGKDKDAESGL